MKPLDLLQSLLAIKSSSAVTEEVISEVVLNKSASETVDFDQMDTHDAADIVMKCAIMFSASDVEHAKAQHKRHNREDDEDYQPFDDSIDALMDVSEGYMEHVADRLKDMNRKDMRDMIKLIFPDMKDRKSAPTEEAPQDDE
jgi:hypothetical protein